jgi:hypothetical protein
MPKAPNTNSTAPPPVAPPAQIPLAETERLRLENLLLRCDLAASQLAQAQTLLTHTREAAIAQVHVLLAAAGADPAEAAQWQVDLQGSRLVRPARGTAQDAAGPGDTQEGP